MIVTVKATSTSKVAWRLMSSSSGGSTGEESERGALSPHLTLSPF